VFPDHFTLEMAEAVISDPPIDEHDAIDLVARPVGRSLVTTVNAPGGLRYQLLEMPRQYGGDRVTERGDVGRTQRRLLAWAMSGVDRARASGPSAVASIHQLSWPGWMSAFSQRISPTTERGVGGQPAIQRAITQAQPRIPG
jgi:hypothetical protein